MKTIALNRMNVLTMPKGKGLSVGQKVTFLAELSRLGYRLTNSQRLEEVCPSFLREYKNLIEQLKLKRGGDVNYVPLFKNFPNGIPDDNIYLLKRVIGYLGNTLHLFDKAVVLENGVRVPNWLFDIYEFGADPITQMQSAELFASAVAEEKLRKADTHVEWIDLRIVAEDELEAELEQYLKNLVYAASSIKEELHPDFKKLLSHFGPEVLDLDQIVFKETKALVMQHCWKNENFTALRKLTGNATDLLRMFAAVTETDVSLATKVKFPKMNRRQRKGVLSILETSFELAEQIKMYQGLWLEIGRYLHPFEYKNSFPLTAKVFDALRNGNIETFASKTEKLISKGELKELLGHLEAKPGVLGRKLHEVLRKFPKHTGETLTVFGRVANQLALKNLLVLQAYFRSVNYEAYRTVVNKKGKIKILYNTACATLSNVTLLSVLAIIDGAIRMQLAEKESWEGKKVWIDPDLDGFTVPLQQRKASDGLLTVGRGSRVPVSAGKVLRLFVYWKQKTRRTDLDLSIIQFDQNFNFLGHVSYTNLKSDGIVHSGDLQSAPQGAAEFVDITLSQLDKNVAYLGVQVYKYCGENFDEMDCHAGWMFRESVNAQYKSFDIKTVANKFDLNGRGAYCIPLIVDLKAAQIISTDLYVGGLEFHNNVENSKQNVGLISSQIARFTRTRPVVSDLALAHAEARKATLVDDREDADITFGIQGADYNATDIEHLLSELI